MRDADKVHEEQDTSTESQLLITTRLVENDDYELLL
jgi:hypothetical protein